MAKYRIKETWFGCFMPQKKVLFWWEDMRSYYCSTKDDAVWYIERAKEKKIDTYHYIN